MEGYPTIICRLCPRECRIPAGHAGDCRIRVNFEGRLLALVYGRPVVWKAVDPVEKKPLYHFRPGTRILSLACSGCNLHCRNCQNWEISQCNPEEQPAYRRASPDRVARLARRLGLPSLALTYSEPFAWYEYSLDLARAAADAGVDTVLVTAAYANREPARRLFAAVRAANIDLKAMNDPFYRKYCGGSLRPVLDNLVLAKSLGVWVEVTNLLIPSLNDTPEQVKELCRWHRRNLGADTPLHFSAFFPRHRMRHLPPTPAATLLRARETALDEGLRYVYLGNLRGRTGSDTLCPSCGARLVRRIGYRVEVTGLEEGKCGRCETAIPGRWS